MGRYVLQMQKSRWDKWETVSQEYGTLEEARAELERKSIKIGYRIAEAYTVTRYKAVK